LFINGVRRLALDLRTTRLAGQLRARAGTGSAVNAIVVATAIRLGGIVATADSDDLTRLAADCPNVAIWSLWRHERVLDPADNYADLAHC
jgi:hypothetical protein